MLTLIVALVAFAVGLATSWAVRGARSWCRDCGHLMACTECPRPIAGRLPHARTPHAAGR